MVRLVWSGSQDTWIGNVESILGKYEGKRGRSRSEVICTMCVPSKLFRAKQRYTRVQLRFSVVVVVVNGKPEVGLKT